MENNYEIQDLDMENIYEVKITCTNRYDEKDIGYRVMLIDYEHVNNMPDVQKYFKNMLITSMLHHVGYVRGIDWNYEVFYKSELLYKGTIGANDIRKPFNPYNPDNY